MGSKRKQVCVIVAGMHRSGTSALTRVLSLLGCTLPTTLLAANYTNESGHWEPQRIQEFNDRLLASAGCAWDDWTPVPQDWFDSLEANARKEEAAELFKAEYGVAPLTVFKDPRVCRLLPFWLSVLDDLGIEAVTAIPVRHPLEVARSLAVRDLSDAHYNRLLWLRHVTDAERYTRDRPRYFCSYDDLLESWSAVVSRMGDALGVKWPRMSAQAVEEIDAFLKPQLRHHRLNPRLLDDDRTEPEWLKTTYSVVARWASEGEDADGKAQLDRISSAMDEAGTSFGILALRGKVAMTKVRELEAELEQVRQARDELSSRFDALAIVLGESQQEVTGLQGQNATSQSLADNVAQALAEANARADAAQSEADLARSETNAVRCEADALATELQEVRSRADRALSEAEAMKAAVKDASIRADATRVEADALIAALEEANSRADATRGEAETLNAALQDARAGGDAARAETEALTEALNEANLRNDAARSEMLALTEALSDANMRGDAARAEVEALAAEFETTKVRASSARSEADALIAALGEANTRAEAAQADAARNAEALVSASELSAQALSEVQETLRLREAELAQLASELSLGRDTLASAIKDLASDQVTSGDLRDQISALVSKLQDAESELGERTKAIDSITLALEVSDERRGQLEIEKDQSEQLVRALKSNIELLLEDAGERDLIRDQLVAAEEELSVLTGRLAEMEADLAHSTSALRQRSAEADDAYGELERVRNLLHTEAADKARLERATEGLKANISLLMSDLSERDGEVARIRSEAEQFRTTIKAGQKRLNELFAESQITVENLVRGITLEPTPLFQSRRTAMRKKVQLIREAGVVDPDWYRSAYPDVQEAGLDPVEHFIAKGYLEGRRPKR